jgi:hypothetical protein
MIRSLVGAVLALMVFTPGLLAQQGIQRGKIKKIDADKGTLTITANGKDHDFTVAEGTRIMDAGGQPARGGLKNKGFKPGAQIMFKPGLKGDQTVLFGLRLVPPPQDIQRGKIKKIDADEGTLTITVNGKDRSFSVGEDTRIMDADGQPARGGLKHKGFKPGAAVMFKPGLKGDNTVLVGLKLVGQPAPPPRVDLSKVKPLTDMGKDDTYKGFKGGLYPDGKNERPRAHEAAGRALAKKVQPLDRDGKPDPNGKIVLLSVGMSNTNQAFGGLMRAARADKEVNPRVLLVNGAQGGMTAAIIQILDGGRRLPNGQRLSYWDEVDNTLKRAGASRAQVQAVWIKQADAGPSQGFPKYAQTLQAELAKIMQLLARRFPNLKLCYLSSRTYGGWAKTRLNPELYAYESGFSVKWLIEQQLKGDAALNYNPKKGMVKAPWLSWGPYLWAKGTAKRGDGFYYEETDFAADGTHESPAGIKKIGKEMLKFFKTDSTTRGWFVKK